MTEASQFPPSVIGIRVAATLSYLVLLLFFAFLQRLQLELRGNESETWWASNGRDVVNAIGVAILAWGLRGVGYPLPQALALGGAMVVLSTAVIPALGPWRERSGAILSVSLVLGVPPLICSAGWSALLSRAFEALFES